MPLLKFCDILLEVEEQHIKTRLMKRKNNILLQVKIEMK